MFKRKIFKYAKADEIDIVLESNDVEYLTKGDKK